MSGRLAGGDGSASAARRAARSAAAEREAGSSARAAKEESSSQCTATQPPSRGLSRPDGAGRPAPAPAPAPPPSSPLLQLRRLTLDDFLRARALVRPTRGRFDGVDHGLGTGHPSPPSDYDESLYD